MSFILDCESGDKACECISGAFNCSQNELSDFLLGTDLIGEYEENFNSIDIPFEQYLYKHIVKNLGMHNKMVSINWFHTTRTSIDNEFSNGIKHLGKVLNDIWGILINSAPNETVSKNLTEMRSIGVPNFHYKNKTEDPVHWGPFGILVRDVAFHAKELAQHDYLEIPEIIEDICNGYMKKYGISIVEHYKSIFVPKIVKFNSAKYLDVGYLETAICYAYEYVRGNPPCMNSVNCFDGEGEYILPEQILSVEIIQP